MNGVSILEIVREQFYSKAPSTIARPGIAWLQLVWLVIGAIAGLVYALFGAGVPVVDPSSGTPVDPVQTAVPTDLGAPILAANAIFTALSVTMAMFFWPRAINLRSEPEFIAKDERWHLYRLTTQLFWTVLVGILATGLAVVHLIVPASLSMLGTVFGGILIGLTVYQVLLLGQCVFRLYAATYWMPKA